MSVDAVPRGKPSLVYVPYVYHLGIGTIRMIRAVRTGFQQLADSKRVLFNSCVIMHMSMGESVGTVIH